MTIGNIWMISLILIWFFYGLSRMFQLPQFLLALRSSVCDVFINFLLTDAKARSKISSDQKRFFIALSLYPLSFFANTPFNRNIKSFCRLPLRIIFNILRQSFDYSLSSRIFKVYRVSNILGFKNKVWGR